MLTAPRWPCPQAAAWSELGNLSGQRRAALSVAQGTSRLPGPAPVRQLHLEAGGRASRGPLGRGTGKAGTPELGSGWGQAGSAARSQLTRTGLTGPDRGCWRAKRTASWMEAKRCCLAMDASKKCPASSWATTGAAGGRRALLTPRGQEPPPPPTPAAGQPASLVTPDPAFQQTPPLSWSPTLFPNHSRSPPLAPWQPAMYTSTSISRKSRKICSGKGGRVVGAGRGVQRKFRGSGVRRLRGLLELVMGQGRGPSP